MLLILLITTILLIYLYFVNAHKYWAKRNVPFLKPIPIMGNMSRITFKKITFAEGLQELINNSNAKRYFGLYQYLVPTLLITDPDLIKQIGIKDFESFMDHITFVDMDVDPLFRKNLLQIKGQEWKQMRSTLSPAFTGSKMKTMFELMTECADQFTNHFVNQSNPNQYTTVEMKDIFTRFANDVIATCAFGIQCDSFQNPNNQFYTMGKQVCDFSGIKRLIFFFNSNSRLLMKLLKLRLIDLNVANYFMELIKITVEKREKQKIYRPDMIHLLMQANKEKLKQEDNSENKDVGFATTEEIKIRDLFIEDMTAQAMIFFLAGFDTLSTLMCHMAHELAVNSDIQEKLQAEIDETFEINGKITYDALIKMKYMDMVVCETLRKWPPAIVTDRVCTANEYTIKPVYSNESPLTLHKGDLIWIPIYVIHRDPKNYPEPDKFDPERFSDENKEKINPSTFIPFGIGQRMCIGSRFAIMEMKVIFFYILSKFDIVVSEKTQVPLKLGTHTLNLIAENGFWLGLKPRNVYNN